MHGAECFRRLATSSERCFNQGYPGMVWNRGNFTPPGDVLIVGRTAGYFSLQSAIDSELKIPKAELGEQAVQIRTKDTVRFRLEKKRCRSGLCAVCRAADDDTLCKAAGPATTLITQARGRAVWKLRGTAACSTAFGVSRYFTSAPRAAQREVSEDLSRSEALAGDFMHPYKKGRSIWQDSHFRIN